MSENFETQTELLSEEDTQIIEETPVLTDEFSVPVVVEKNKIASLLNIVSIGLIILAVIYTLFQLAMVVIVISQSGMMGQSPFLTLISVVPSALLPTILVLALGFAFKFLAEMVRLVDKISKK